LIYSRVTRFKSRLKFCYEYIFQQAVVNILHPRLLKIASTILKYPLSKLFNKSLQSSYFPHMWKLANVTPVFKNKGEKDCKCKGTSSTSCWLIDILHSLG
jgi:hypothetical protein